MGTLLGQPAPKPSKWRSLARWRDWSLPVKLGAVTLVPIVIALVLGGITLGSQLDRSDRYDRVARFAELGAAARTTLDGVQRERAQTAELLTAGSGPESPELNTVRGEVDRAVAALNSAASAADPDGIAAQRQDVTDQLGRLAELREQVGAGQLGAVQALTEYSSISSALLNLDVALVAGMGDDGIGGTPSALHDLLVAKEEVSVQQALIGYGVGRGGLAPSEFNQLRTSDVRLTDRLAEFRIAATDAQRQDFDSTVSGEAFDDLDRVVDNVLAGQDSGGSASFGSTSAQQWADTSGAVFTALGEVSNGLGGQVTSAATDLADGAGTGVVVLAVVLVVALLLAAAVVFLITRQLLRSLKLLRTRALEVAEKDLPAAVRTIQEGRSQSTDVQPVPVLTDDEIGQVARAFDAVHSQALRLAVEQAGMRTGYASVFVNLSRRSQSLVQRQLQLIERLERDEEDADQLATLFQLDHLATRMRRNNENLMVLSGAEPGRRSGQPVSTTDVLRAAVSEIEQYQRVSVRTPPQQRIVGYAAGDLVRLVAELLDNATAFSAPETQVTVATRLMDDNSLSIDIVDRGIGMNEAEVSEANARLTEAGSVDLATSRRMGLFVVGRLASRHGFGVTLNGGKDIVGVRATVLVPAELVMSGQAVHPGLSQQDQPTQQLPAAPQPSAPAGQGPGGLPRRKTNGVSRPNTLPAFSQTPPSPPSAAEVSGTALFTPIGRDEPLPEQSRGAPQWPQPREEAPPTVNGVASADAVAEPDTEATGQPEQSTADGAPGQPAGTPDAEGADDSVQAGLIDEALSGKDLFAANSTVVSDWWSAATTESDAERKATQGMDPSETTPIFDEMLSVWFRSDAETAPQSGRSGWDFAADERWRTVQAVAGNAPADYTDAGLPRRRKGEQLLPGSAVPAAQEPVAKAAPVAPAQEAKPEVPARDAVDVRSRLNSFQQGVSRGRRQRTPAEQQPPGATPAQPQTPDDAAQDKSGQETASQGRTTSQDEASTATPQEKASTQAPAQTPAKSQGSTAAQDGGTSDSTAEPQDAVASENTTAAEGTAKSRDTAKPRGTAKSQGGSRSSAKPQSAAGSSSMAKAQATANAQAAAKAQANAQANAQDKAKSQTAAKSQSKAEAQDTTTPEDTTKPQSKAGTPDKTKSQGKAETQDKAATQGKTGTQDKAATQSKTGTQSKAETQDKAEIPGQASPQKPQADEAATPEEKPKTTASGLPRRQPRKKAAPVADPRQLPEQPAPARAAEAGPAGEDIADAAPASAWAFATDDSWRTVQQVADSSPASFTSAGLPRRRRGEQLLPGSMSSPGSTTGNRPRTERDPADVRGRLSSFQQGIRRGRHRTAQATESSQEKVEGE
ncbi:sensor histidine kinase [Prauserella cavernicola]|uniref:sensor histidine kinase n=1 Tax=Prauserella cavernicola TaxID=2800127 RepID=UPI0027DDFF7D|nr:nitrate- and nitrite sensing domain-containing protein [Prauserella cavernicola]